ncbi:MAG: hypothetical protein M1831_001968 [Alyxoria varia]|nr:MAG: hypothetical protein M1831_001968 [Alyxoria varia]
MEEPQIFDYPVPEGFNPLAEPTKPENRLPEEQIKVLPMQEEDLEDFAAITYATFPPTFWAKMERVDQLPPLPQRISLMARHFRPFLHRQGYHFLKAVHTPTSETVGIACWHETGPSSTFPTSFPDVYPDLNFPAHFTPNAWRADWGRQLAVESGMKRHEIEEMYAHFNDEWFDQFLTYDKGRVLEMGDRYHWYIAPVCVKQEWQARGVGKALMMWGLRRADEKGWPCVLESMPNARPVYYKLGFVPSVGEGAEGAEGGEDCKDTQLVRPVRTGA